jgi:beta-phosphoglucomutase
MINYTTVKAVIFDLDGVLVDTAIYHFQAWHDWPKTWAIRFPLLTTNS